MSIIVNHSQSTLRLFDENRLSARRFSVRTVPVAGMARLCPLRTEAAIPLSVSVRDGHVSVSAGFARLADGSTVRIWPAFAGFPRCSVRQATSR